MGSAGLFLGVEVLDCAQENSGERVSFEVSHREHTGLWSVLSSVGCGTFTGLWSVLSGAVVSCFRCCGQSCQGLWSVVSGAVVSCFRCCQVLWSVLPGVACGGV